VVKYGGSSLADHEHLLKAVDAVTKEVGKGTQIVVVVSAMGRTTDLLLNTTKNVANGKIDKRELDDILAMGERTSIRIFATALRAQGIESRFFDPLEQDWPIITDDAFSNANPNLEQCEERIQLYVLPFVEKGVIPVIAGFVGRTIDGKITTLGRGGSDTTAFILAKALKANQVILVTDSDGIMSADPKIIGNPKRLPEIDVNTLSGLADSGTKFIHRKALKYKADSINIKVINHAHGDLSEEGTLITGALSTELDAVVASPFPAASITVLGQGISEKPEIIQELTDNVKSYSSTLGLSMDHNSAILYVSEKENINLLFEKIHEIVLKNKEGLAMSVRRNLAFIKISGVGLEETPGLVGNISDTLRQNEINIFGILTITSSILLFVDWNQKEKGLTLIKNSLRRY
jgi:aspartate kinase